MSIRTRDECGCSLAAEVLEQNGTVRLRVSGQSMLPTLWPGDTLTIQSKSLAEAEPGQLVLYDREGRFFVHRLISKSATNDFFATRGDCMVETDPVVPGKSFLGTVVCVTRGETLIVPDQRLSLTTRMLAISLRRSGFLQRVVLRFHRPAAKKTFLPRLRRISGGIE